MDRQWRYHGSSDLSLTKSLSALILIATIARADISATIDKLDTSDGLPMPAANLVIVDIAIDVSPTDAYWGLGLRAFSENGASLVYARDPNGDPIPSAPGTANRFVTFFSRPRDRDANGRFGSGAAVNTTSPYCSLGGAAIYLPDEIDAVGIAAPNLETGRDGFVFRLALDLSSVTDPAFRIDSAAIIVATSPPHNALPLLQTDCDGDFDAGIRVAPQFGSDVLFGFGVYAVPEPATGLLVLAAGSIATRRRRSYYPSQ